MQSTNTFHGTLVLEQEPAPINHEEYKTSGLCLISRQYYQDIRNGKRVTAKGRPYSPDGWRSFKELHDWIAKYAATTSDPDIIDVHDGWLKRFIRFLYDHPISLNTVSGIVANLHAMVNALILDKVPFTPLTIRVWPEDAFAVYNIEDELKIIQEANYSHPTLELVRDFFLIQSNVGFRKGTLTHFLANPKRFLFQKDERWFIRITTNKTNAEVYIPVKKIVHDILVRWDYKFPMIYAEHYYDSLIKIMAKEAGLDQELTYTKTIQGERVTFVKKKYEMMSTHTARRNFATNGFLAGIPIEQLMMITGHKTREMFLRYVRADSLANAIAVSKHPFFQ